MKDQQQTYVQTIKGDRQQSGSKFSDTFTRTDTDSVLWTHLIESVCIVKAYIYWAHKNSSTTSKNSRRA